MSKIPPIKTLNQQGILDEGHGLSGASNTFYKGITKKEEAIAALAGEMELNLADIKFLQGLIAKNGPFELEEGTEGYERFNALISRLKAQGHDIDISQFCSKTEKNGKIVLVFDDNQKNELKEKLEGLKKLTEHTKEQDMAELQKLTSEEKDLWNLLSNMVKIYYDQVKSIVTDTGA